MKLLQEQPPLVTKLYQRLSEDCHKLFSQCERFLKEEVVSGQQRVQIKNDEYYVLLQGNLFCGREGSRFFVFEERDFIPSFFCLDPLTLETDFAVKVARVKEAELIKDPQRAELLHRYLQSQSLYFCLCAEEAMGSEQAMQPYFYNFEPGQTILLQGQSGDDVYTLLEGTAEVHVDGVKVGEIGVDEIFGAIAALTNTKRTASVIAKDRCVVLSINKDRFLGLMRSRPVTVLKMLEDMAKSIVSLNQKVVDFTRNRY